MSINSVSTRRCAFAVGIVIITTALTSARGDTYVLYNGGNTTDNVGTSSSPVEWSSPANWSPEGVPGASDTIEWATAEEKTWSSRNAYLALDGAYAEYYYAYYGKKPEKRSEYTEKQAAERAGIAEKYGFTDIQYALYHRTRTLSASEYRTLIGTYSDHIAMVENIRERFFNRVEEVINEHGGSISLCDTIDLQLARKPE